MHHAAAKALVSSADAAAHSCLAELERRLSKATGEHSAGCLVRLQCVKAQVAAATRRHKRYNPRDGGDLLRTEAAACAPQACLRLRGGGGDGGATGAESRSSYLEMYKTQKTGEMDAREEQLALWTCCRLTRQPLGGEDGKQQVVACQLGYLYNREPVLQALKEHLVDGVPLPVLVKHVASLKDLTTLQLAPSGAAEAEPSAGAAAVGDFRSTTSAHFACPLTGLLLNGRCRFVVLRPSGVVVSERALKTAPDAVAELLGGQPLASQAVVALNGTAEEVEALRLSDAEAKAKKHKKKAGKTGSAEQEAAATSASAPKRAAAADGPPRVTGATDRAKEDSCAAAKRFKAGEHLPAGATPSVWASIFTSSSVEQRTETFGARALSFRR